MSIFVSGEPGERIEKTMSLSLAEFERSLTRIEPDLDAIRVAAGRYQFGLESGGLVKLEVAALQPMLMGGLVNLPRCKVVISFQDVPARQRAAFLTRFDQAFQRGGG